MKAILEFNLPDDQQDFDHAVKGGEWQHSMWTLHVWLRGKVKHAPDNMPEAEYMAYSATLDQLNGILDFNDLKL